jgi:hypothetical protein
MSGDSYVGAVGAGAITAAAFAAGAIDNAAFNVTETLTANPAAGGIAAASFAAGAIDNAAFNVTETLNATIVAGGIASNAFAANAISANAIDVGAIEADAFAAGAINAAAIAADAITDAKVAADVTIASVTGAVGSVVGLTAATVHADLDDIQARLPAALVSGRMNSNVAAINDVATGAARIARSTQGIVLGTVASASTTSNIVTSSLDPAAAASDQFKGRIVTFEQGTTTANLRGQSTDITASTPTGGLSVTPLTTAPVSGDVFVIT